ncbi:putative disease resistance protein RGA1 [Arachis duranensis]|uniref:Disease resistance protein RGA1 n=1 Tax=Arachis duranensis TaxID=130453 RepID=A0A6P5N2C9_ARADU|nr:putative disease resistance protein RGA1 [Arachis duranensis]
MENRDTVIMAGAKVLENGKSHEVVNRRMWSRAREVLLAVLDVIEEAEKKQARDPEVKLWFEGVKDICYELTDVSEEFELVQQAKKLRFVGLRLLQHLKGRRKMKSILREFEALREEVGKLKLGSSSELPVPVNLHAPITPSNISGKELILGREAVIQDVISKLTDRHVYHPCISLVGESGIGKTAIARHVYESVRGKFHFATWVTVSKQFNVKRIVKSMLKGSGHEPVAAEMELLEAEIQNLTVDARCLIVLDDVFHLDPNRWFHLLSVLGPCSSMFLITTQMERVAELAESTIVFMRSLLDEDCWSIIKHHAFGDLKNESPVEWIFGQVGREIAKKCQGKPAVAKSVGNMLRGRSYEEWHQVLQIDRQWRDLRSSSMWNFSLMPPALRQCLLYCSIFPKNYSIQEDKLIKLWMAQGFIASDEDMMEIEGRKYVKQLRDCSAFQDGDGGLIMDEGMTDFIQDLAQNECRIMFLNEGTTAEEAGENRALTKPPHYRHCTLCLEDQTTFPDSIANAEKLHTLMVLSESSDIDSTNLASLLSRMKRIRALDLSSCTIQQLPLKAAELLHLRYLNLSFNHELKKLPSAISNLLNLQTLNLNGCNSLRKLPKSIGKLIKLRHLEILWTTSLSYLPKGIATLTLLRTLNRFFGSSGGASRSKACSLGDLENLNNIQEWITIDGLGGETEISEAKRAGLKNKKNLFGLELWFSIAGSEGNHQILLDNLKAPSQLQSLGIFHYGGSSFPNWIIELNGLKQLLLANCSECNVLPPLGKLPCLESLEIKNMPKVEMVGSEFLGIGLNHDDAGNEGSSSAIAFPRLQKLHFITLGRWKGWTGINGNGGDEKVMPLLSSLSVVNCESLRSLPDYIKKKENLKPVIEGCSRLPRPRRSKNR